jgi:hypothetical protein
MAQSRETDKEKTIKRKEKYGGMKRAMYLENYLAMGMIPTPTSRDYKSSVSPKAIKRKDGKERTDQLSNIPVMIGEHCQQRPGITSQLNPLFVEEMMGFPENWTLSPFLNGEGKVSKDMATP